MFSKIKKLFVFWWRLYWKLQKNLIFVETLTNYPATGRWTQTDQSPWPVRTRRTGPLPGPGVVALRTGTPHQGQPTTTRHDPWDGTSFGFAASDPRVARWEHQKVAGDAAEQGADQQSPLDRGGVPVGSRADPSAAVRGGEPVPSAGGESANEAAWNGQDKRGWWTFSHQKISKHN